MAYMAHVLDEKFLDKLPNSENMYLDPKNTDHQDWMKHQQQNEKAMTEIVEGQESEDVLLELYDSNKLTVTSPGGIAPNYWKESKNMFQPNDGLSEMSMEEDLHKPKFTKKGRSKESVLLPRLSCSTSTRFPIQRKQYTV
jgi:hypothetical protein